ncbi:Pex19 protein family-domain-containing protein [Phakopsora pachyrhizi]|uniref:Pex19 protein family-domain-containing protein n=1 Tax=Phakopsora pachyrhizi TaxID=170000 RepID=A0AAV0B6T1_PHAPC|nr:Pex19 protein family-domain-containing protein [Phakopsora pachyrhizi]CAH7682616.1 Pex19 protein family-domain-containing protein [Phakopsora pachyrhizi]
MSSERLDLNGLAIEDDMEDDEDFDNLLDRFEDSKHHKADHLNNSSNIPLDQSKPSKATTTTSSSATNLNKTSSSSSLSSSSLNDSKKPEQTKHRNDLRDDDDDDEKLSEDFIKDLTEGMEALLAGIHDQDNGELSRYLESLRATNSKDEGGGTVERSTDPSSIAVTKTKDDDQKAHLLSASSNKATEASNSNKNLIKNADNKEGKRSDNSKNFQDAIQDTIEKLKQSEDFASSKDNSGNGALPASEEELASLLERLMTGDGEGLNDEGELQKIMQSFMEELMSKEIMYEPMRDMNRLYGDWISSNRPKLSIEELKRYESQCQIVKEVVEKFEDPRWDSEEKRGGEDFSNRQKEVVELLNRMQDLGPPPKEIMGEMPPGFLGEDGLPNPEQCIPS